jgi:glucosamine-6-phosphate deaminase
MLSETVASPYEKAPAQVFASASQASKYVAGQIADLIRSRQKLGQQVVLGLATGSTPTGVYAELIRLHKNERLSFRNVVTFNLDEYFPMQPTELQSYVRFMREHLFDHVDIDMKNVHIPDGTIPVEKVNEFCRNYEQQIKEAGGIDLQLLGIGRTGHVGFNEPGSAKDSRTRLITLDKITRLDAASDFFGDQYVPRRAITMGVGSILSAKRVILMAFGEGKASVLAKAVEGPVTSSVSASFLQEHPNTTFVTDEAAAADLTRFKSPWLVGTVDWTPAMIKKAVIWLALKDKKPILMLTDEDYNEAGLQDLLATRGNAYEINREVFRAVQETITGWPGGKPQHLKRPGDIPRKTDAIFPKRALIFSPHPDDDVISMGGTFIRLADNGHDVHVAYQTSGNIAVFDADAIRFTDFARDFNKLFGIETAQVDSIEHQIEEFLKNKKPGQVDSPRIQQIKGLIRRGEAKAAAKDCGIKNVDTNLHFLDMPFYETGTVRKKPIGEDDVKLIVDLLRKVKPHQIYAAGDLSDPHGTHRVCLDAIFRAVEKIKKDDWFKDCEIWLYRGAWQEWEPEKIEMAVPLSPQEQMRKRIAIFKHQSQKDKAMYPGADEREFWERAEDRNRETARIYDQLGMAQYAAIEGFVQWKPQ